MRVLGPLGFLNPSRGLGEGERGSHDDMADGDDSYNSTRDRQSQCSLPTWASIFHSVLFTLLSLILKKQGKGSVISILRGGTRHREVRELSQPHTAHEL